MTDTELFDHIYIRAAEIDDVDVMTKISISAKQSNGYDDAFMDACRDELTVTVAHLCQGEYWVACDGTQIIGCASLCPDKDHHSGQIHSFFIDPDHQGQGVGRMLWDHLLMRAHAYGMSDVRLDADPNAVPFYKALGFESAGEVPSGSIAGRSIPHMRMCITK